MEQLYLKYGPADFTFLHKSSLLLSEVNQVLLPSTAGSDTNIPFQTSPTTLSKCKTQWPPLKRHSVSCLWPFCPCLEFLSCIPHPSCYTLPAAHTLYQQDLLRGPVIFPSGRNMSHLWLLMLCPQLLCFFHNMRYMPKTSFLTS